MANRPCANKPSSSHPGARQQVPPPLRQVACFVALLLLVPLLGGFLRRSFFAELVPSLHDACATPRQEACKCGAGNSTDATGLDSRFPSLRASVDTNLSSSLMPLAFARAHCSSANNLPAVPPEFDANPSFTGTCGFGGAPYDELLRDIQARFGHCEYAVYTVSFLSKDYTSIPSIKDEPGVCTAIFVDATFDTARIAGKPWQAFVVPQFYESTARTAHALKMFSHRLFPAAKRVLYLDSKSAAPQSPHALLASFPDDAVIGVMAHFDMNRSVALEIIKTSIHLRNRNSPPRDFEDIERQRAFYERVGYSIEGTGMVDSKFLVWNLQHPCAALGCYWLQHVARLSMREQLNFHYVLERLRLGRNVTVRQFEDWNAPEDMTFVRNASSPLNARYVPYSQRFSPGIAPFLRAVA